MIEREEYAAEKANGESQVDEPEEDLGEQITALSGSPKVWLEPLKRG
jgi:hypothetical protein